VNHETLKTFGINLGYNAYTYGVNQIRENEKKYCFIIPWALIFSMENPSKVSENDVEKMISQGVKLGIYTYFIFCTTNQIKQVAHLLEAFEDCVFVIFLEGASIKTGELEVLYTYHNFMISIASESRACIKIMAFLRKRGFLYAMHAFYNDCKAEEIITGKWLKSPLRTATTFAFLISESTCSLKTKNEVRNYVINGREKQHYPLFLIDITSDISYINEVISEDSHFIGFNSEGQLYTSAGVIAGKNNNLRTGSLQEILKQNRSIKE